MTEVLFYHLTESTLEDALPSLLERSLERGWRAAVQTASEERRDMARQPFVDLSRRFPSLPTEPMARPMPRTSRSC